MSKIEKLTTVGKKSLKVKYNILFLNVRRPFYAMQPSDNLDQILTEQSSTWRKILTSFDFYNMSYWIGQFDLTLFYELILKSFWTNEVELSQREYYLWC